MIMRRLISLLLLALLALSPASLAEDRVGNVFTSAGLDAPEHSESIERLKSEIKSAVASGATTANPYLMPDSDIEKVLFMLTQGLMQYDLIASASADVEHSEHSYDFKLDTSAGIDNDGCFALDGNIAATIYGEDGETDGENSDDFYARQAEGSRDLTIKLPFEDPVTLSGETTDQPSVQAYRLTEANHDSVIKLLDIIARNLQRHDEIAWLVDVLRGEADIPETAYLKSDELIALMPDVLRELGTDGEFLSVLSGESMWPTIEYLLRENGIDCPQDMPIWQRELFLAGGFANIAIQLEHSLAYSRYPAYTLCLSGRTLTLSSTNNYSGEFVAAQALLTDNGFEVSFLDGPYEYSTRGKFELEVVGGVLSAHCDIADSYSKLMLDASLGLSGGQIQLDVDEEPVFSGSYTVDGSKFTCEAKYDYAIITLTANLDPADIELSIKAATEGDEEYAEQYSITSIGSRESRLTRLTYSDMYGEVTLAQLETSLVTTGNTTKYSISYAGMPDETSFSVDGSVASEFNLQSSHPVKLIADGKYALNIDDTAIDGDYNISQALEVRERKHTDPK